MTCVSSLNFVNSRKDIFGASSLLGLKNREIEKLLCLFRGSSSPFPLKAFPSCFTKILYFTSSKPHFFILPVNFYKTSHISHLTLYFTIYFIKIL